MEKKEERGYDWLPPRLQFISNTESECIKMIEDHVKKRIAEYGDTFDMTIEDHWLWIAGLKGLGDFLPVFNCTQERWRQNKKRNRDVNRGGSIDEKFNE